MTSGTGPSRFGLTDVLLVIPSALLVALFAFDLTAALTAPLCSSPADLGTGCVALGWEGPFADAWSNRSRSNAIIDASLNFGLSLVTLGLCAALLSQRNREWVIPLQIGLVLALVLKRAVLTDVS